MPDQMLIDQGDAREPMTGASAGFPPLVIITSVHGNRAGDQITLDLKALEGFEVDADYWPGQVYWMLSFRDSPLTYSVTCDPERLPVKIIEVATDRSDVAAKLPDNALLVASADDYQALGLARALPGRVVYIIEYTLKTRLDALRVANVPFYRKIRSVLWELLCERQRKRAIRASVGLQCNGLPAYHRYGPLSRNAMQYFDTRLTAAMQIDARALGAKQARIGRHAPLRLGFSGRIDRMKGAQFLVPLMRRLKAAGIDVMLETFGSGELSGELEAAAAGELAGMLTCHGPVPFATELVPAMKERIDLFVCPHPQGDPSCTYIETLGCGVPIVGFANEAWAAMVAGQNFGEAVPMGDVRALADAIIRLDHDRERLAAMAGEAARFSSARSFEIAHTRRLDHYRAIAAALG